jgi:hypothetical protein
MEDFRLHILAAEQTNDWDVEGLRIHLSRLKPYAKEFTEEEKQRVDSQKLRLRTKMTSLIHYNESDDS